MESKMTLADRIREEQARFDAAFYAIHTPYTPPAPLGKVLEVKTTRVRRGGGGPRPFGRGR